MKKAALSFLLITAFGLTTVAETQDDGIPMPEKFALAKGMSFRGEWEEALSLTRQILLELPAVRDLLVVAKLEMFLGDCHLELANFEKAHEKYFGSRDRLARMGSPNPQLLASLLNKIGNYFNSSQEFNRAIPYLDSALIIRKGLLGEQSPLVGDVYNNLGSVYLNIGDFERALEYHQQAYQIRDINAKDAPELLGQSLNNIGLCHHDAGQLDLAMRRFRQAIDAFLKSKSSTSRQVAEVHLNIGNVFSEKAYEKPSHLLDAKGEYEYALKLEKSRNNTDPLMIATCYNNLANVMVRLGNQKEAITFYNKALEIKQKRMGNVHPEVAQTMFNIGFNQFSAGNFARAQTLFDKCKMALQYDAKGHEKFNKVQDLQTLLRVLYLEIVLALERYKVNLDLTDLKHQFSLVQHTDQLIDYIRTHYEGSGSKQKLTDIAHEIYSNSLELAFILYNETQEEKYWHQAFYYSEKSRGVLLLEALQKSKAETFLGIPDDLLQELDDIEAEIVQLEKRQFLQSSQNTKQGLQANIFELKRSLERKVEDIAKQHPNYYNLRYETNPPSVSVLQSQMEKDQSLLTYFVGDEYLWIFVVNHNDFKARQIPLNTYPLTEIVQAFLSSITSLPTIKTDQIPTAIGQYAQNGRSLFEFLLTPVEEYLSDRITIIPDGVLAFLPFEALLTETPDNVELFKEHKYLINRFAINYNYSCRLLLEMSAPKKRSKRKSYIGFAPDFSAYKNQSLKPLKYNGEEIKLARKTLGGDIYIAADASKSTFLSEQVHHQIVHLATHGMANTSEDEYSFVAFSASSTPSEEDALLFVREIYDLKTEADIVVLSACETAAGRYYQGEGIASIARGFSYAGASSLMATRWNVNDRTTKDFMEVYFTKIWEGVDKDLALQGTVKEFVGNANNHHAHPFYWSSFITIGNMDPVVFAGSSSTHAIIWIVSILALFSVLWLIVKRRLKASPKSN